MNLERESEMSKTNPSKNSATPTDENGVPPESGKSYRAYWMVGLLVAAVLIAPGYQYLTGHAGGDQGCGGDVGDEFAQNSANVTISPPSSQDTHRATSRPLSSHTIRLTAASNCLALENPGTCLLQWSSDVLHRVAKIADSIRSSVNVLGLNFQKNPDFTDFKAQFPNMPVYAKNMGRVLAYENPEGRHPLAPPWDLSVYSGSRDSAISASMTKHDPKHWAMETRAAKVRFVDATTGKTQSEWRPALFAVNDTFPLAGVNAWNDRNCAPFCGDRPPWRFPRPFRYSLQIRDSKANTYQLGGYCGKRTSFGYRRPIIELASAADAHHSCVQGPEGAPLNARGEPRFNYDTRSVSRRATCAPANEIAKGVNNSKCAMGAGAFCSPALLAANTISEDDPLLVVEQNQIDAYNGEVDAHNSQLGEGEARRTHIADNLSLPHHFGDYRRESNSLIFRIGYLAARFKERAMYKGRLFSADYRERSPSLQDFPCYMLDPSKPAAFKAYKDALERVLRHTGAPGIVSDDMGGTDYIPSSRASRGIMTAKVREADGSEVEVTEQVFQYLDGSNEKKAIRYMPGSPSPNPGEKYQLAAGYGTRSWHYRPAFDDEADPAAAYRASYFGFLQRTIGSIKMGKKPFSWMINFSTLGSMLAKFSPNLTHGYQLTKEIFSLGMWDEKWTVRWPTGDNAREVMYLKLHAAREASRANRPAILTTRIFNYNDTDLDLTPVPASVVTRLEAIHRNATKAELSPLARYGHNFGWNLESGLVNYLLVLEKPSITIELARIKTFFGPNDLHTLVNLANTIGDVSNPHLQKNVSWLRAILDLNAGRPLMEMGRIAGIEATENANSPGQQSQFAVMYRTYENLLVMRNAAKDQRAIRVRLPERRCPKSNIGCDKSYYYLRQRPWAGFHTGKEEKNKNTWDKIPLPMTCQTHQGYDFEKAELCAEKLFKVNACADPKVVEMLLDDGRAGQPASPDDDEALPVLDTDDDLDCAPAPTAHECDGKYCKDKCIDKHCAIFILEKYQGGDVVFIPGDETLLLFHKEAIPFHEGGFRLLRHERGQYLRSPKDSERNSRDAAEYKLCKETEGAWAGSRCTRRVADEDMLNAHREIILDPKNDPDMLTIPPGM
jgi:hypothetical protein